MPDNGDVHQQQAPRTPASKRGQRQLDGHGGQQAELEARRPRVKHHVEPDTIAQQRGCTLLNVQVVQRSLAGYIERLEAFAGLTGLRTGWST
jgi:hypothetical protein